jgi:hypothetical protein
MPTQYGNETGNERSSKQDQAAQATGTVSAKKGLAKKAIPDCTSASIGQQDSHRIHKDARPSGRCWHAVGTLLVEGWENRPTRADIFEDTSLAGTGRRAWQPDPSRPTARPPVSDTSREPSLHSRNNKELPGCAQRRAGSKNLIKPVFSKKKPFLSSLAASFQFLSQLENPFRYSF